jgi:DNA-binding MarR family transcriptional regulator
MTLSPQLDSLEDDVRNLWSLLFTIVLDGEKRLGSYLAAHELTPPQFYVLKTLAEHDGRWPIGEIARQHHLTNATMTGLVKRLEAFDPPLVTREQRSADRRSWDVVLTADGAQIFQAIQDDILAQVRVLFGLLSAAERQDLMHYLRRYLQFVSLQFPMGSDPA